jgi:carbonic anhydrase/acetyltransferase-like protein (isoleucine patch superfamily)
MKMIYSKLFGGAVASVCAAILCGPAVGDEYKVLDPEKSAHLVESDHFVARWNDGDGVELSDADLRKGLETLERIRTFYLNTVGFSEPYEGDAVKYKASINISNKGWATGSGTGKKDPAMWLHFNAFKDDHALAHEFAHCLQYSTMGMRDSLCVGWFWESHAEWMAHQMFPDQAGCSFQLLEAPHLYYGSTRDRYGNWQFWEYIKDTFGYSAINDMWSKAKKLGEPGYKEEDPLSVLARNMEWSMSNLNDQFGLWAMHNVTWDYKNGKALRRIYGSYDDRSGLRRNRVSILKVIDETKGRYMIPEYRAPQRGGYNLVRIMPEGSGKKRAVHVRFKGLVQDEPAVAEFKGEFENEPKSVPDPNSDWRWGLVAVDQEGKPRYSALQRGAQADLSFSLREDDKEVWLAVAATPSEMQQIFWDQMYYTIYRYPWAVEIKGGKPEASHFPSVAELEKGIGKAHSNGGGWVDTSAEVDQSVYVGPNARVLENAKVEGNVRIEDYAVVRGNAKISDQVVVCGQALVGKDATLSGDARIEDEASVYDASVGDQARIGALTLVEGRNSRISGKADVRAVMNRIHEAELSGSVRLIGDIELSTRRLAEGVFYGMVTDEMAGNPRWGAKRSEPAAEVTKSRPGN